MQRRELEGLTREELIAHAERLGVPRPRTLTQAELIDEILTRSVRNERERAHARGFLGRARDLLARVVERGLHLPEAARALRGGSTPDPWPPGPPPLPTVTLAEIYAAQGHLDRAIAVLDEVLAREPDHEGALELRARLAEQARRKGRRGGEAAPAGAAGGAGASRGEKTGEPGAAPASTSSPEGQPEADAAAVPAEENVSAESPPKKTAPKHAATSADADQGSAESAPPAARLEGEGAPAAAAPERGEKKEEEKEAPPAAATQAEAGAEAGAVAEAGAAAGARAEAGAGAGAAADAGALEQEDEDLPGHYDVDEVVGMAVDPETIYLYWEVRPTTLARARARRPDGLLVIRLVAVLPTWEGPHVERRDLTVDALFGDRFVRDIPAGANVRLSIGWLAGADFDPFAVGLEIAAPRSIPGGAPAPRPGGAAGPGASAPSPEQGGQPGFILRPTGGTAVAPATPAAEPPTFAVTDAAPPAPAPPEEAAPPPAPGPERFPSWNIPTPDAIARAVAATRGGSSELALPGVPGPGGVAIPAPLVESWFRPGGASDLSRGGASDLSRGGASDLSRGGGPSPIESWFRGGASELSRHGGASELGRQARGRG